jgi:hypothetical protein
MIPRHITELLYHHECVIVPGLGGFIKAYKPAKIIHATHEFFPPSATIAFNAGLSANDGILADRLATSTGCSYREALAEIRLWVETCLDSIKKGEKIEFVGIGDLFQNTSGKLEFIPSAQFNFNLDSFGLPVFYSKAVDNESIIVPQVQTAKHFNRNAKIRHLIPETLKWAAVLAPFLGFVLWSSLNGNVIDNYVHNYTGIYSWARSTPGKTVPFKNIRPSIKAETVPQQVIKSPASALTEANIAFEPGMISYAELDKNKIKVGGTSTTSATEVVSGNQNFFVIGGAFRDHNNALKLISILQQQGYSAQVIDTTPSGLFVVSMSGFSTYNEATVHLKEIKNSGYPGAWILNKQKG